MNNVVGSQPPVVPLSARTSSQLLSESPLQLKMSTSLQQLVDRSRALGGGIAIDSDTLPMRVRFGISHLRWRCCPSRRRQHRSVTHTPRPPSNSLPALLQRDLTQLYDDAVRMGATASEQASAVEVMSRAQRLLLSTGGFDVESATREALQLQLKV